jgi:hypothetical protein
MQKLIQDNKGHVSWRSLRLGGSKSKYLTAKTQRTPRRWNGFSLLTS